RRFDAARLALIGDAQAIALTAGGNTPYHPAMLSTSTDVLAFATVPLPFGNRLGSIARAGNNLERWKKIEAQNWPRVSPDGGRLALQRIDPIRGNPDIWVDDLVRRTQVRVT